MHRYVKEDVSPIKKKVRYVSYIALTIGMLLLFWSFYPVISFELYSRFFLSFKTQSPLASTTVSSIQEARSILGTSTQFSSNLRDFTQAHLWFPGKQETEKKKEFSTNAYFISIPKLNITKAKVSVGGDDLTKNLVHYLPKTMPGEYGNVAIFGHSTLPQLYNVNDYKTIFTYLPSLEKGNKIIVHLGDLAYEYEVIDMFVVNPDKISVLEQQYDAAYLTLVTCVPPGTFWKRLVVKAKLLGLP